MAKLVAVRGAGKIAMRPVSSTATTEALVEMESLLTQAQDLVAGLEEGGGGGPVALGDLPAFVLLGVWFSDTWPDRPTARTNLPVLWLGGEEQPPGMLVGVDVWLRTVA